MKPISSGKSSHIQAKSPIKGKKETKKTEAAIEGQEQEQTEQVHVDSFTPAPVVRKKGLSNMLISMLNIRVPTTTKSFALKEKEKVLDLMQPGDIILENNDAYPVWQILEKMALNSDFTHAAIYEGDGKFLEATPGDPSGKGVLRSDLREYMDGRINLQIIRPPYKTPEDREAALNYAKAQLGKPYDAKFSQKDDDSIYCSELVQRALASMPNPINVAINSVLGKKVVSPDAFQKIPGAKVVFTTKNSFARSLMSHIPVYLTAAVTGLATGCLLGAGMVASGCIGGGILMVMLGNKLQAGKFSLHPE